MISYLLTPPNAEPVSVADAKLAARIDGAHWDPIVTSAIAAARRLAEHQTGRHFMQQTWRVELTDWPAPDQVLRFLRPTAVAVSYWNGSAFVALAGNQVVWVPQDPGIVLVPALGVTWPALGELAAGPAVRVDVTLGVTDAALVPPEAVLFIKSLVALMVQDPSLTAVEALNGATYLPRMLDSIRLYG